MCVCLLVCVIVFLSFVLVKSSLSAALSLCFLFCVCFLSYFPFPVISPCSVWGLCVFFFLFCSVLVSFFSFLHRFVSTSFLFCRCLTWTCTQYKHIRHAQTSFTLSSLRPVCPSFTICLPISSPIHTQYPCPFVFCLSLFSSSLFSALLSFFCCLFLPVLSRGLLVFIHYTKGGLYMYYYDRSD